MTKTSQKNAVRNYRKRLVAQGLARFEVLGLAADRGLIRSLARRLATNDSQASDLRAAVRASISSEPGKTGGILEALRRSPLVGAELNLKRSRETGRKIDL